MKNTNVIIMDLYELADEILEMVKKCPSVEQKKLNTDFVCEAIFKWLDDYYLPAKMRWCTAPEDSLDVWCKHLLADSSFDNVDTGYDESQDHLIDTFNEMFRSIMPGRTWLVLSIRRVGNSAFALEVGGDYRINYYMNNVHKKKLSKTKKVG